MSVAPSWNNISLLWCKPWSISYPEEADQFFFIWLTADISKIYLLWEKSGYFTKIFTVTFLASLNSTSFIFILWHCFLYLYICSFFGCSYHWSSRSMNHSGNMGECNSDTQYFLLFGLVFRGKNLKECLNVIKLKYSHIESSTRDRKTSSKSQSLLSPYVETPGFRW